MFINSVPKNKDFMSRAKMFRGLTKSKTWKRLFRGLHKIFRTEKRMANEGKKSRGSKETDLMTPSCDYTTMLWSTSRDALRPIYVTEITQNFPENIFLPFVTAKYNSRRAKHAESSEGRTANGFMCSSPVDIEEIFAWVYDDDVTAGLLQNAISTKQSSSATNSDKQETHCNESMYKV